MKLAIIGSRGITDINLANYIYERPEAIISGGARGVDTLAANYARANNINLVEFLPDYKAYGRGAPLRRNLQIIEACDEVLAFWDGQSRGTLYTIRKAQEAGKPVKIIHF